MSQALPQALSAPSHGQHAVPAAAAIPTRYSVIPASQQLPFVAVTPILEGDRPFDILCAHHARDLQIGARNGIATNVRGLFDRVDIHQAIQAQLGDDQRGTIRIRIENGSITIRKLDQSGQEISSLLPSTIQERGIGVEILAKTQAVVTECWEHQQQHPAQPLSLRDRACPMCSGSAQRHSHAGQSVGTQTELVSHEQAELEALQAQIAQDEQLLRELQGHLENLEQTVAEQQLQLQDQDAQLYQRDAEQADLEADLDRTQAQREMDLASYTERLSSEREINANLIARLKQSQKDQARLKRQLAMAKAAMQYKTGQIQNISAERDALIQERQRLSQQIRTQATKLRQLEEQNRTLHDERASLSAMATDAVSLARELQHRVANLRREKAALNQQINGLNEQISQLKNDVVQAIRIAQQYQMHWQAAQKENARLRQELEQARRPETRDVASGTEPDAVMAASMQTQTEATTETLDKLEQEHQAAKAQSHELAQRLQSAKQEIQSLDSQNTAQTEQISLLKQHIARLSKQLSAAQASLEEERAQRDVQHEDSDEAELSPDLIKDGDSDDSSTTDADLVAHIKRGSELLSDREAQIEQLQDELLKTAANLEEAQLLNTQTQAQLAAKEKAFAELEAQYSGAQDAIESLTKEMGALKQQLETSQAAHASVLEKYKKQQEITDNLLDKNRKLEEQVREQARAHERAEKASKALAAQSKDTTKAQLVESEKFLALVGRHEAQTDELRSKKEELSRLQQEQSRQAEVLRRLQEQLTKKEEDTNQAIAGQAQLDALYGQAQAEIAQLEQQKAAALEEMARLNAEHEQAQNESSREIDRQREQLASMEKALASLKKELAIKEAEKQAHNQEMLAIAAQAGAYQAEVDANAQQEVEKAQDKTAKLAEKLKEHAAEIAKLNQAIENNRETAREKAAEVRRLSEELAALRAAHTKEIEELKKNHTTAIGIADARQAELQRQLEAYDQRMKEKEEHIGMLQAEIADLRTTQAQKILTQDETIAQLQRERAEQQEAHKTFIQEIEKTKQEVQAARKAKEKAERELAIQEQEKERILREQQRDAVDLGLQREKFDKVLSEQRKQLEAQIQRADDLARQQLVDPIKLTINVTTPASELQPAPLATRTVLPLPVPVLSLSDAQFSIPRSSSSSPVSVRSLSPALSDADSVDSQPTPISPEKLASGIDDITRSLQPSGAGIQMITPSLKVDTEAFKMMLVHRALLAPPGAPSPKSAFDPSISVLLRKATDQAHHIARIQPIGSAQQARSVLKTIERTYKDFFDYMACLSKQLEPLKAKAKAKDIHGIFDIFNQPVRQTEYGKLVKTKTSADKYEWSEKLEGYILLLTAIKDKFPKEKDLVAECERRLTEVTTLKAALFKLLNTLSMYMIEPTVKQSRLVVPQHSRQSSVASGAGVV